MSPYSLHFIIALLLATIVAVLFSRTRRLRLVALLAVPISFYTLFYNFNYGIIKGIFPIMVSYAGSVYICILFFFITSIQKSVPYNHNYKKIVLKIILASVLQSVGVVYAILVPWAIDTFPLSNVEAVLFTLFAGANEGAEEFVISSLLGKVIYPAIQVFCVMMMIQMAFAFALNRGKRAFQFSLWKIKYSLCADGFKISFWQLQKGICSFLALYCFIQSLILPGIILSAPFKALFQVPVDSELYRNHFVHPDSLKLETPDSPRNLIVIMMESMETNFENHTPEIVNLQRQNTNFAPGGVSVSGTSWTIAGITGKLCGIPLNMPMGINEYLGKLPTYLPHARCLMDVLEKKNYRQIYMQGSSGDFTQKRTFWAVHGNVEVHDIEYYTRIGKIPEKYNVFWGFEDRKLYNFAKNELDSLSKMEKPFALYMLTVDTHQPEGYVDAQCAKEFAEVNGGLPKALRCASKQLDEFLIWAKQQPWYANTVISVMGDHTMPSLSPKAGIPVSDSLYWTNFIINSAVTTPVRERQYSSLDMFPTLLEAMGFELENRSAGLGRSLYSDSLTMLELYGRQTLDSLLRERSIQYDEFLFQQ
ncbi:MAG: LTA synthase family protein [Fibrobacter sp.]|nr:LTA synthase family protein [Fibrobacter sp.]